MAATAADGADVHGLGIIVRLARWVAGALGVCAALIAEPALAGPRVFSLDQCADQYVLALSPRADIAGLSTRARNADAYLRAEAAGLPEHRATTESVLAARPQVVVRLWGDDARLAEALRRRAMTVVQLDDANDFAGVRANVRKVAAALGQPAAGEALIARMDAQLAAAARQPRHRGALYVTPGALTAGSGTLVGAMLAAAGYQNLAPGPDYSSVSVEQLILHPPSALVLGFFTDLAAGNQHWTLAGSAPFRRLAAQRTVASLPGKLIGCPAWFAADAVTTLAAAP